MYWCTDVLHQVHSSCKCEVFDVLKVPDFIQRRSGIISLIFKEREYCQSNDIILETSLYCVSVQQELSFSYWDNTNSPFASRGCELSFQRWQELGWPCCPQQPPAQPCWGPPWASQRCRARASSLPQSAARQHTTALGDSPNTSRLILTLNLKKTPVENLKKEFCATRFQIPRTQRQHFLPKKASCDLLMLAAIPRAVCSIIWSWHRQLEFRISAARGRCCNMVGCGTLSKPFPSNSGTLSFQHILMNLLIHLISEQKHAVNHWHVNNRSTSFWRVGRALGEQGSYLQYLKNQRRWKHLLLKSWGHSQLLVMLFFIRHNGCLVGPRVQSIVKVHIWMDSEVSVISNGVLWSMSALEIPILNHSLWSHSRREDILVNTR